MPESEQEFLRPASIAPLLGVGVGRVYQLVAAGVVPSIRRGRSILIPRAAWERWLVEQRDQALSSIALQGESRGHS
jgi:excisionase family DNA binding protein